jgi:alkylation response protein AidB-like acyl-CoA dehydrogenase
VAGVHRAGSKAALSAPQPPGGVGQRLRDVTGVEIGDGTVQVSRLVIARNLPGREFAR